MKNTAFTAIHEGLGAKMVPFVGFNMPVEYSGIRDEHTTVREKVGVFDVSHMGEFLGKGPKAYEFTQRVTSNDVSLLTDGKIQYSCFPNGKGGIVDDLLVYRIDAETYLLVVNAANIDKDWAWCAKQAEELGLEVGQDLYNASDEIAQLAVQGPLAVKTIQKLVDEDISDMVYYTFKKVTIAGVKDAILSTTGYTGSGGFEIYVANKDAAKIWEAVFAAGEEFGIKPAGLGCRDTLRLEMGFCLYGNDINDETSPIEAGLGWITKLNDANNCIDKELYAKQKEEGVTRRLKAFEMVERGIPRQHYDVVDAEGSVIGEVTSGTMSPSMNKGIGLAYLNKGFWKEGTEIFIQIRAKKVKAQLVKLPFYKA